MIFGGGSGARQVYSYLEAQGIKVNAFCESQYFYRPGKMIEGKRVYNYNEIDHTFSRYYLILAASGPSIRDTLEKNCDNRKGIYVIDTYPPLFNMTHQWVQENADQLDMTYQMLEDELSRETMLSFVDSKAHCMKENVPSLWKMYIDSQYFNSLYKPGNYAENALIDCGAWIGDTAQEFLEMVRGAGYQGKVYSFEPEKDNYEKLLETARKTGDIECYNYAVSDKYEKLNFAAGNSSSSHLSDIETGVTVEAVPVDALLRNKKISMVKMDLEGAEVSALMGMEGIITEQMPHLAICVYHRVDDLITIPNLIKKFAKRNHEYRYRYYLRQHSCFGIETVFYAVPERIEC